MLLPSLILAALVRLSCGGSSVLESWRHLCPRATRVLAEPEKASSGRTARGIRCMFAPRRAGRRRQGLRPRRARPHQAPGAAPAAARRRRRARAGRRRGRGRAGPGRARLLDQHLPVPDAHPGARRRPGRRGGRRARVPGPARRRLSMQRSAQPGAGQATPLRLGPLHSHRVLPGSHAMLLARLEGTSEKKVPVGALVARGSGSMLTGGPRCTGCSSLTRRGGKACAVGTGRRLGRRVESARRGRRRTRSRSWRPRGGWATRSRGARARTSRCACTANRCAWRVYSQACHRPSASLDRSALRSSVGQVRIPCACRWSD